VSFALIDMRFELTTRSYVVIVVTFAETSWIDAEMFVNSVKTDVKAPPGKSYGRIDKRFVRTRVTSITISGM
jgi:hypothetical protein